MNFDDLKVIWRERWGHLIVLFAFKRSDTDKHRHLLRLVYIVTEN